MVPVNNYKILFYFTEPFNPSKGGVERVSIVLGKWFKENGCTIFYLSNKCVVEKNSLNHIYLPQDGGLKRKENCMGHRTKRFFQWSGKMGERFWKPKGLGMIGKMGWIFRSGFSLYMAYICFTFEGLFFGYSGDCFTSGLQMGLKRPGRVLFSAVWPFYGWVDGFCYMMVWTAVWPFFCAYF